MFPGNRLRQLRKAAGLTQGELAEKLGHSQSAVSQWESGKTALTIEWMRILARLLGCQPADFLEDRDNPDRLDEEERLLIQRYRNASAAERETLLRVSEAVVPYRVPPQDQDNSAAA